MILLTMIATRQNLYRVTQKKLKKIELTKSLTTHETLFSLKQKFYSIMYNQHLQSQLCTTKNLCSTAAQRYVPESLPDRATGAIRSGHCTYQT